MSFPVVFNTENCAVHSVNPTVSSVYLPTQRWHHLKTQPFLAIHSADGHRMYIPFKYHFLPHILRLLFFFLDNIMADVASKQ
jgi:hypothetical protein